MIPYFFAIFFSVINLQYLYKKDSKSIKLVERKRNLAESINYVNLALEILSYQNSECSQQLNNTYHVNNPKLDINRYPSIIDHIGKSLNEMADEIECLHAFNGTIYLITELDASYLNQSDDNKTIKFLDMEKYVLGACIFPQCEGILQQLFGFFISNNFRSKNTQGDNIVKLDEEKDPQNNNFIKVFCIILIVYAAIKFCVGIYRIICIPKGYEKFGNQILQKKGIEFNIKEDDENSDPLVRNKNAEILPEHDDVFEISEYNPDYDFSSSFPIYLRTIKFFDLFNDIKYLTTKRNKYFNDKGLEYINFLKTLILFLLIFSNTFTSQIKLPSKDILNKSFFCSSSLFVYRFSLNALNFWIVLEGMYTSYKLINYIQNKIFELQKVKKHFKLNHELIKIFGKFLLLFIPKIIIFLIIYFMFYYNMIEFMSWFEAKVTFKYVVEKVAYKDINIKRNSTFNSTEVIDMLNSIFSRDSEDFIKNHEFIFLYLNIFASTILSMIILYLTIIIRSAIFEIIINILNIGLLFGLITIVDDDKYKYSTRYQYYHFRGQEYFTKAFYLAFEIYYIGFSLGILIFNYDRNKINWKKEKEKSTGDKVEIQLKKATNDNSDLDLLSNGGDESEHGKIFKMKYYPLSFMDNCLKCFYNLSNIIKFLIIILIIIMEIIISMLYYLTNRPDNENESFDLDIEFSNFLRFYFLYEKHLLLLLFCLSAFIICTLPKTGWLGNIIGFKLIVSISRVGFCIACLYSVLSYFFYCSFMIKIRFNLTTFILISIGNFFIVYIFCVLFSAIFELPLRNLIKKIFRIGNKSNEMLLIKKDTDATGKINLDEDDNQEEINNKQEMNDQDNNDEED